MHGVDWLSPPAPPSTRTCRRQEERAVGQVLPEQVLVRVGGRVEVRLEDRLRVVDRVVAKAHAEDARAVGHAVVHCAHDVGVGVGRVGRADALVRHLRRAPSPPWPRSAVLELTPHRQTSPHRVHSSVGESGGPARACGWLPCQVEAGPAWLTHGSLPRTQNTSMRGAP